MAKRSYQFLRAVQTTVPTFRRESTADGRGFTTRMDGTKHGTLVVWIDPEHPAFVSLAKRALRSKTGVARVLGGAIKAQVQSSTVTDEGREP